jgi:hypothetical protein
MFFKIINNAFIYVCVYVSMSIFYLLKFKKTKVTSEHSFDLAKWKYDCSMFHESYIRDKWHTKIINKVQSILLRNGNLIVYYIVKWFGDFPMFEDCFLMKYYSLVITCQKT